MKNTVELLAHPGPESAMGTEGGPSTPGHIFGSARDTFQAIMYHHNKYFHGL